MLDCIDERNLNGEAHRHRSLMIASNHQGDHEELNDLVAMSEEIELRLEFEISSYNMLEKYRRNVISHDVYVEIMRLDVSHQSMTIKVFLFCYR